jgi:hypothetical protein
MFGERKEDCPLWRGACKESKCRWYVQVLGQNPNTGEQINKTGCAVEFLPMLLIENAQQSRQTGASVDGFKNEMVRMNGIAAVQNALLMAAGDDAPRLTEGGAEC